MVHFIWREKLKGGPSSRILIFKKVVVFVMGNGKLSTEFLTFPCIYIGIAITVAMRQQFGVSENRPRLPSTIISWSI